LLPMGGLACWIDAVTILYAVDDKTNDE